jgi:malate dehydrogenase (oxaloacetate-decarboxylating)
MNFTEEALKLHEEKKGKFEIKSKVKIDNKKLLSLAYSPGVAEPCLKIVEDKKNSYKYTARGNLIAVVTDGSAVLGLGDIGPEAAMPVMEGKAILFKEFANVDAIPICLDTKDVDEIVKTVKLLEPSFGGINLEDISAPRCFEVEERLKKELNIPVFHDDQHGTAIVVLAGLINALKIVKKDIKEVKIVLSGAGAAGVAITKLLIEYGAKNIIVCDKKGIIDSDRDLDKAKKELAKITNPNNEKGSLKDAIENADVFIGVSAGGIVDGEMIKSMNENSIVFALANPIPEVMPKIAKENGVRIIATGRSDYPNQINNVLVFPGIFRALLDFRIKEVDNKIKIAVAKAIAETTENINEENIVPDVFDKRVVENIKEAMKSFH